MSSSSPSLLSRRSTAELELPVPPEFRCPISLELMRDPVVGPTGITYDRAGIEAWLLAAGAGKTVAATTTCPVTKGDLRADDLVPNHALRRVIQAWCVANRCRGVERIPTPRVPVTPAQAGEVLGEVEAAARAGDAARCGAAVREVGRLARESDRDRRCLASAGAARALAAAVASFAAASDSASASSVLLDDVLAALVLVMPLDEEAIVAIGSSAASVALLANVAKHGDLQRRLQAVVVIREIVALSSCCSRNGGAATAIDLSDNLDGIIEVLVNTIRDPISPQATKASLVAAYHLALADDRAAARLAEAGLVPSLVELLIDGDRSTAEKALAALDATLASEAGRARARADALAVPVLVKKMFRVSDTATELVVSALHRICKKWHDGDDDEVGSPAARRSAVVEAVQVGAFQKVMMLLQVGCRDATKEKATELLKLMIKYETRGGGDCIDAMDFRGLKRVS
uniref:U-box domain-containing protein n=1 Tax=Oryza glumipatula TaxID=40148 RepID=A0A0E0B7C8_9ORYZ